jgi:hypothetical protein
MNMEEKIFCSFANTDVKRSRLNAFCKPFIGGERCEKCPVSPALELGMPVEDLINQMRG